jgi:hypothetical protein
MGIAPDYFSTLVPDPRDIKPHRVILEKYLGRRVRSYLPADRSKTHKDAPKTHNRGKH